MIDEKRAEAAFCEYTDRYGADNSMITHKVTHTLRVAKNCRQIAESLHLDGEAVGFAWLLGLLHDIGRFEQVRRYGTFIDAVSLDHAEFGADLLFKEELIRKFPAETLTEEQLSILETAIRLHNKLALPEELNERTLLFCNIIRDADKVDIFRVICEMPFEQRIGTSKGLLQEAEEASSGVMECVLQHRCVPRSIRKTRFEGRISHGCLAFELVFQKSRDMVREQGCLSRILSEYGENGTTLWNEKERAQLRVLRKEIESVWGVTL